MRFSYTTYITYFTYITCFRADYPPPTTTTKRPATHSGAGRFVVSEPLYDYFIASRFTSFFAFAARAESLAIALFNWLLASLRLPSFAAMTARR